MDSLYQIRLLQSSKLFVLPSLPENSVIKLTPAWALCTFSIFAFLPHM